mmetsp:Transcript_85966/g.248143  ORF Transcript_85966/g.248143 Transcript_85966/m.248143 type:complete len:230 (+) Transcript_85966:1381-2070(+)
MRRPISAGGGSRACARAIAWGSSLAETGDASWSSVACDRAFCAHLSGFAGGTYSSPASSAATSRKNSVSAATFSAASGSKAWPAAAFSFNFWICCNFFLIALMRLSASIGDKLDGAGFSAARGASATCVRVAASASFFFNSGAACGGAAAGAAAGAGFAAGAAGLPPAASCDSKSLSSALNASSEATFSRAAASKSEGSFSLSFSTCVSFFLTARSFFSKSTPSLAMSL